jgi:A/G-specific adenine glycosylase
MLKPRCEKPVREHGEGFRDVLVGWFEEEGKDYPWRRTRDAYEVLVSEVMLQQTRIATVLDRGFYERFLERFPKVGDLAEAGDEELLKAWEGLGYYRRVRMLRDTARAVVERYGGVFPEGERELMELPGVGRYTVGALRALAFGVPAVLVDGNVVRVLARVLDERGDVHSTSGMKRMWEVAAELADHGRPREYHSALMELGQTHCRRQSPGCMRCPVSEFCATRDPDEVPVKRERAKVEEVEERAVWVRDGSGCVLMHRERGSRRTGLWKLPLREEGEVGAMREVVSMSYAITRYRVRLRVYDGGVDESGLAVANRRHEKREGDEWVREEDIAGLAMAAPFRRAVDHLLQEKRIGM